MARGQSHTEWSDEAHNLNDRHVSSSAHLELSAARTAWRAALEDADLTVARREEIEQAALHMQSISDTAYFYAGLAFGLTFIAGFRAG